MIVVVVVVVEVVVVVVEVVVEVVVGTTSQTRIYTRLCMLLMRKQARKVKSYELHKLSSSLRRVILLFSATSI